MRKKAIPTTAKGGMFSVAGDTRNRYRVPKKQWAKWPPLARRVFNAVYREMRDDPALFASPEMTHPFKREQWQVTCWNAAWLAASALHHQLTVAAERQRRG